MEDLTRDHSDVTLELRRRKDDSKLSEQNQELDKKDLKILALRQNLGELEDKYSDLQVEATVLQQQLQAAVNEIGRLGALLEENGVKDPNRVEEGVSSGDVSTD